MEGISGCQLVRVDVLLFWLRGFAGTRYYYMVIRTIMEGVGLCQLVRIGISIRHW
jgi:hypothetical protein